MMTEVSAGLVGVDVAEVGVVAVGGLSLELGRLGKLLPG